MLLSDCSYESLDVFRVDEAYGGSSDDSPLVGGNEELPSYRDRNGRVGFGDCSEIKGKVSCKLDLLGFG